MTVDQEPNADQPGNVPGDKSGVMYSDSPSDVDDMGEQELVADDQPGDVADESGDDTGDQSDITVEYSQETMAELPVGQNEQTGEADFVLPLKKRKYECVDKQHEILQKELFFKLEHLDYQKWCQDTQSQDTLSQDTKTHAIKQKYKTVHDRKQKSSHSLLCPVCHKGF